MIYGEKIYLVAREKAKGDFEVNPKSVIIDGTEYKCLTYQDYENEYNDEYYEDEYEVRSSMIELS